MIFREGLDDCRAALRRWSGRPMLPATVVLTLALGIGAAIAIFSIANAVLIKPFPWPDPERLFAVRSVMATAAASSSASQSVTWEDCIALRHVPWLDRVGCWTPARMLLGPDRSEAVGVIYAASDVLSLLGATPVMGRFFRGEEDWDPHNVVLLSHRAWTQRFGGSPGALDQSIILSSDSVNGRPQSYAVIGILPPGFSIERQSPEFVLPSGMVPTGWRMGNDLPFQAIARSRATVSIPAASDALDRIAQSSGPPERRSLELRGLSRELLGDSVRAVILLFSAAGLLLLVSCSSASGLLLGNAVSRRTEIAVRRALGASRLRIARQLAWEHALLGICASVVGLIMAAWLTPLFIAMAPARLPRLEAVSIDLTVVLFALSVGASSPIIFGAAPSVFLGTLSGPDALTGSRAVTARPHGWQQILVAIQIGLAVVLVVSASLLGGTLLRLRAQPLGFEPEHVAVVTTIPLSLQMAPLDVQRDLPQGSARPALTPAASADLARAASQRYQRGFTSLLAAVIDRIAAVPGVSSVAASDAIPFLVPPREASVRLDGGAADHLAQSVAVSPNYFQVMGIQMVGGRTFDVLETPGDVAVVSEAFEREVAGGGAVGRKFTATRPGAPARQLRVVGVVADVSTAHGERPQPTFYMPVALFSQFVVRMAGDAAPALPLIRESLRGSDARVAVTRVTTMDDVLAGAIAEEVFRAALSALFGGLALILSLVGVNALVVRWVADRRHDLGVRIALGATPADVRSLVLRQAGIAVAAGIGAGVPAAVAATRLLGSFLVDVSGTAVLVYIAAPVSIAFLALAGVWLPVVRAGRMTPLDLFRAG